MPTDWALRRGGRCGNDDDDEAELPLGMISDALKLLNCDLITVLRKRSPGGVSVTRQAGQLQFTWDSCFRNYLRNADCTANNSIALFLSPKKKKQLRDSSLEGTIPRVVFSTRTSNIRFYVVSETKTMTHRGTAGSFGKIDPTTRTALRTPTRGATLEKATFSTGNTWKNDCDSQNADYDKNAAKHTKASHV